MPCRETESAYLTKKKMRELPENYFAYLLRDKILVPIS